MDQNKITWMCHIIAVGVIATLLAIVSVQERIASELRSKVSELEEVVQNQQFLITNYKNSNSKLIGNNNE